MKNEKNEVANKSKKENDTSPSIKQESQENYTHT